MAIAAVIVVRKTALVRTVEEARSCYRTGAFQPRLARELLVATTRDCSGVVV